MPINKAMQATLRALTHLDKDVTKTYKVERRVKTISGRIPHRQAENYIIWDQAIFYEDYHIPVRIFQTKDKQQSPSGVLLFFHGGGWISGNIDSYSRMCSVMSEFTNHCVVSVDYRLAPEHPFPYALEDCYTVAREVLTKGIMGIMPDKVTLIGDSAGGNLAAAVSLMARDRGEFMPARQILLYPLTYNDHSETSIFPSVHENGTDYLLTAKRIEAIIDLYKSSDEDLKNPYFVPLLAEDFSNQPRTLIITAEYDPLRDEGEAYGEKLRQGGNGVTIYRMADALHGFMTLPPQFDHVKIGYDIINGFLRTER